MRFTALLAGMGLMLAVTAPPAAAIISGGAGNNQDEPPKSSKPAPPPPAPAPMKMDDEVPPAPRRAESRLAVPPPTPRIPITQHTLKNGLKLLMVEDHKAPVVTFQVWYQVGSKDERPGITGVSHLLEHMLFQGAKRYGTGEFDKTLVRNGGQNNAFTTQNFTAYYETFASDRFDLAFDLESDRMMDALIPAEKLKSEREVVKEELRWRSDNSPVGAAWESLSAFMFLAHPYHWPVGGWPSDIAKMTHEEVVGYYKAFYRPDNATVVIVGDFKTAEAISLAERYFGPLKPAGSFPRNVTEEPPQNGERRAEIVRDIETPVLVAGYRIPGAGHKDLYAIDLLDTILSSGESSRLYQSLVYKSRVAQAVETGLDEGKDWGIFYLYGQPMPGKSLEVMEKALYAEIDRLKTQSVTDREFQKALNVAEASFIFGQESAEDLATTIGTRASLTSADDVNLYLARLRAVTKEDIKRVATTYLRRENRTAITLRPGKE